MATATAAVSTIFAVVVSSTAVFAADASPSPSDCARPNIPAHIVKGNKAETPAMARQMGMTGTVVVRIHLDEQGHILDAKVWSSPSHMLNSPALASAKATVFQAEVRDCKPVPSSFDYIAVFNDSLTPEQMMHRSQSVIPPSSTTFAPQPTPTP